MPWLICFFSVFSWFQSFLPTPGRAYLAVAGTGVFFFFGSGFPADTISRIEFLREREEKQLAYLREGFLFCWSSVGIRSEK